MCNVRLSITADRTSRCLSDGSTLRLRSSLLLLLYSHFLSAPLFAFFFFFLLVSFWPIAFIFFPLVSCLSIIPSLLFPSSFLFSLYPLLSHFPFSCSCLLFIPCCLFFFPHKLFSLFCPCHLIFFFIFLSIFSPFLSSPLAIHFIFLLSLLSPPLILPPLSFS